MEFSVYTMNDNGSGMVYHNKEEFLKEVALMIDDCVDNGGTFFSVQVNADSSCFHQEKSYTAFLYEEDGVVTADMSTYDTEAEAVEFAKYHNWDEVVNDVTGEIVWRR